MKTKTLTNILAAVFVGALSASAQNTPPSSPGRPSRPPIEAPAEPANIKLNFKETELNAVLEYLSKEAGFKIISSDVTVQGKVTAISAQPMTKTEAFDMLTSILYTKGYAAIRNNDILTIVDVKDAKTRLIPVKQGADPDMIPPNDEMVTQIIPIRYANASQLVQNLQPLLDEDSSLTANESSNALIMTDTQANIRRVTQIVQALDTSISGITAMRVYPLKNATAAEAAEIINQVMGGESSNNRSGRGGTTGGGGGGTDIRSQIMSRIQSRFGGGGGRGGR